MKASWGVHMLLAKAQQLPFNLKKKDYSKMKRFKDSKQFLHITIPSKHTKTIL